MSTKSPKSDPMRLAVIILRRNAMIGLVTLSALAAWLAPGIGATSGPLHPQATTKVAVALIFFFQGLLLPLEVIRAGLKVWKLHAVTQGSIFLLAPALAWLLAWAGGPWLTTDLRMGLLFLGVLPTTVATAAALTAQVGGNVAGALFNTCLSNVAGIFIVPAAVTFFVAVGSGSLALLPLIQSIALQLLLPLLAGQALRPWLGSFAEKWRRGIGRVNSALILFMLYAALCNAVEDRVWKTGGLGMVLWAALGAGILLMAMTVSTFGLSRAVRLNRNDAAAAVFCGSQKTLAAGVPLAQTIFSATGGAIGIVLLPLIFYHAFQLSLGVILASLWGKGREREDRPPT